MKLNSAKLRGLIKERGLTMGDFGTLLKITREGAYDVLKRKDIKQKDVDKICQALKVQASDFIDYPVKENVKESFHVKHSPSPVEHYQLEIASLKEEIKHKNETIETLQEFNDYLKDTLSQKLDTLITQSQTKYGLKESDVQNVPSIKKRAKHH